jgi:hypothetical protein
MSHKGIVYILVNPCLDGWVKIGMSDKDDVKDRLAELNRPSNIPLSFRAYAVYHAENPGAIEQGIHKIIDTVNYNLRARETIESGTIREREFFRISPEMAFEIFKSVAKIRGDENAIELIEPSNEEQEEEKLVQARRPRLNLKEIGIPDGAELVFVYDETIKCNADCKNNKLIYESDSYSIAALAIKMLNEKCGWHVKSIAGAPYFKFNGQTLSDIRDSVECGDNRENE